MSGSLGLPGRARQVCIQYLLKQVSHVTTQEYTAASLGLLDRHTQTVAMETASDAPHQFGISPFYIPKGEMVSFLGVNIAILEIMLFRDR